jgi:hypothetical protein
MWGFCPCDEEKDVQKAIKAHEQMHRVFEPSIRDYVESKTKILMDACDREGMEVIAYDLVKNDSIDYAGIPTCMSDVLSPLARNSDSIDFSTPPKAVLQKLSLALNAGPSTVCTADKHVDQKLCKYYQNNLSDTACYWRNIDCQSCGCMAAQDECRGK